LHTTVMQGGGRDVWVKKGKYRGADLDRKICSYSRVRRIKEPGAGPSRDEEWDNHQVILS